MSLDSVVDLPPAPASNDMPLNKQVGKEMSSPTKSSNPIDVDCEKNPSSEKCLPKFQIVENLPLLQRIEDRQKHLAPLTDEILKSREKAHHNEALRAAGKIPEGAPVDVVPTINRPAPEKAPQVYDAGGLDVARQRARDEGKNLVIEVYGEHCTYCKQQDATMEDREVKAMLQNAIVVKINGDQNRDLVQQFGVTGYPTTEIYKPGQNEPLRYSGAMKKRDFLNALR